MHRQDMNNDQWPEDFIDFQDKLHKIRINIMLLGSCWKIYKTTKELPPSDKVTIEDLEEFSLSNYKANQEVLFSIDRVLHSIKSIKPLVKKTPLHIAEENDKYLADLIVNKIKKEKALKDRLGAVNKKPERKIVGWIKEIKEIILSKNSKNKELISNLKKMRESFERKEIKDKIDRLPKEDLANYLDKIEGNASNILSSLKEKYGKTSKFDKLFGADPLQGFYDKLKFCHTKLKLISKELPEDKKIAGINTEYYVKRIWEYILNMQKIRPDIKDIPLPTEEEKEGMFLITNITKEPEKKFITIAYI